MFELIISMKDFVNDVQEKYIDSKEEFEVKLYMKTNCLKS